MELKHAFWVRNQVAHTFELSVLSLLLLDLTSELLFGLPEDVSLVLSDLSFLDFGSFWLRIADMAEAVLLTYVIFADVVRQRHCALINLMHKMNELSAVRLVYVVRRPEPQSAARTEGISHGRQPVENVYTRSLDRQSQTPVQHGSIRGWHALRICSPAVIFVN